MLIKTIDGLFVGTRYGVWVLGILGIVGSVILILVNFTLGFPSTLLCVGALCLSITVATALFPKQLIKGSLLEKRFILATITGVIAIAIVGIVYFTNGGFPELNLIFA